MNIKIAHESPIEIFNIVREYTDYDYALVHLLEESKEYRAKFMESKLLKRDIYLDTSIFELGEAFDEDKFAEWVKVLEPTYYFVPDALEDKEKTIRNMESWNKKYSELPGGKIGVVQGKDFEEIVECYDYMNEQADVDMIAISFDYSFFEEDIPHPNKYISWALGRVKLLGDLHSQGIINENKKHHLLGCALPIEFRFYREAGYKWIYSLDTSNPVVHAIKRVKYEENLGLMNKESQKLFEMINTPSSQISKDILFENLYTFRRIVNGKGLADLF
jgi:hypothetical protein